MEFLNQFGAAVRTCDVGFSFAASPSRCRWRAIIAAGQLGFPMAGSRGVVRKTTEPVVQSWEAPPDGVSLTFRVDTQRLAGLPERVPFPAAGDLRWRPATAAALAEGDVYVPLARLVDQRGGHYGDAMAFIEHKASSLAGGKTLYVWMRMPELLGREATFLALFRFAADRLEENRGN